jgi:hypothetical protein
MPRMETNCHARETRHAVFIYIEKLNGPFLFGDKGTPAEYAAGLDRAFRGAGSKSMTPEPT